jgi:hypothetical protein
MSQTEIQLPLPDPYITVLSRAVPPLRNTPFSPRTIHQPWMRAARTRARHLPRRMRSFYQSVLDRIQNVWPHFQALDALYAADGPSAEGAYAHLLDMLEFDLVDRFIALADDISALIPYNTGDLVRESDCDTSEARLTRLATFAATMNLASAHPLIPPGARWIIMGSTVGILEWYQYFEPVLRELGDRVEGPPE